MEPIILKGIYGVFMVIYFIIRRPHERRNKQNVIINNQKGGLENALLLLVFIGMMILPLIYVFTDLFSFADYYLPLELHLAGILLMLLSAWLFYRSHHDLGKNWSPTLQVRKDHSLITNGIYQTIRHPMYTAIWLWVIAQGLLLTNWIAGLAGVITFGTLYFFRVGNEENMMLEQFGDQYQAYRQRTKRLVPFLF